MDLGAFKISARKIGELRHSFWNGSSRDQEPDDQNTWSSAWEPELQTRDKKSPSKLTKSPSQKRFNMTKTKAHSMEDSRRSSIRSQYQNMIVDPPQETTVRKSVKRRRWAMKKAASCDEARERKEAEPRINRHASLISRSNPRSKSITRPVAVPCPRTPDDYVPLVPRESQSLPDSVMLGGRSRDGPQSPDYEPLVPMAPFSVPELVYLGSPQLYNYKKIPPRVPLVEGEVNTIEIQRGCYDLGISIIGGIDTPLVCVIIQEVFQDGVAYKDGRLRSGDQVLEVNGEDLTRATHEEARQALSQLYPICTLTIYRERADESHPIEKEEVFKITLQKVPGKQLGVKLVGKKNGPGVYILSIIPGGLAAADGRLSKDDRLLEINQQDVTFGTQEMAANIIQSCPEKVSMVVSRCSRPQTPDLIRSASKDCLTEAIQGENKKKPETISPKTKDRVCTMTKLPTESLGISVAGGVGSQRGDVPIYITNIQPDGCVGKNKTLKKGDVLLSINGQNLLGLTHNEAVRALKTGAEAKNVTLKFIDGPETCDGIANFTPSWSYWLQLPRHCQVVKTIALSRSASGSLGFSVVGGNDPSVGNQPIHVKTIVPKSPADQDGRLRCGDIILSVNNYNLCDIEHTHAVSLLKHVKGTVALNIVSWPGTIV